MDVFEALADPIRRQLLIRLRSGPARVVDLAAEHQISRPAISRHLRVLGESGLVAGQDQGRERHYRLLPAGLKPAQELLEQLQQPAPTWDHALDALGTEVRRTSRDRRNDRQQPAREQETA